MGALRVFASLLLVVSATSQAQAPDRASSSAVDRSIARHVDRWAAYIEDASARFGIPEEWIRRVIHAESRGQTILNGRPITSSAGAMGLMQLMPATWAEMREKHRLGPDPRDPHDNILAGTAYLRAMYDRFGYPGLFPAYNAGPERYARYTRGGEALPSETMAYMLEVAPGAGQSPNRNSLGQRSSDPGAPIATSARLFAVRRGPSAAAGKQDPSAAKTLFAINAR